MRSVVTGVIAEPQDCRRRAHGLLHCALSADLPTVPIIAYCDVAPGTGGDAVALVPAGVYEIVLRGLDEMDGRQAAH